MTAQKVLTSTLSRVRHPNITVRWRLTVLYGALFFTSGIALLAITYALVDHASVNQPNIETPGRAAPARLPVSGRSPAPRHQVSQVGVPPSVKHLLRSRAGRQVVTLIGSEQRIADLHQLEVESAIALGIMALLSTGLGWLVAGRVLAPLRTITATTHQISEANLHERLAMKGPRDELRQLADTIDELLERLQAAFDAQRRFVANASHELRTPLAMMRTTLDVAAAKPEGVPPQTRALDADLRVDLDHADQLLDSFLVLARAQHGQLGERRSVALEQIITVALAVRAEQIAAKQIELRTALAPVLLDGIETLLARMVENLIENAVRHNSPHGFIEVTSTIDADIAQLTVDNGGPVLDEDAVAQLVQPFRRLGADRAGSHNGHGLGLSIVAAVTAAHDGTLELSARPQGGLHVQITLPGATLAQPAAATR